MVVVITFQMVPSFIHFFKKLSKSGGRGGSSSKWLSSSGDCSGISSSRSRSISSSSGSSSSGSSSKWL